VRRLIPALAVLLLPALVGCGSSKSNASTTSAGSASGSAPAATTGSAKKQGCTPVQKPTPHRNGGQSKPRGRLDPHKAYTVTVETNCGTFAFKLDVKDSPNTTAAFAGLVRRGYFDGLTFHRIVPGFVIQGGDPTGTGAGGPGFKTVDPPPQSADYKLGVVAMAKTQTEPSGAAGSQFFVVTGQDAQLPPDYALLGKVTKGIDVVEAIGKLGNPTDQTGTPTQTVVMKKVSVSP
jgi:peptidyl-prolyl cis-trans isomerase B (cyclophilin B)